LGVEIWSPVPGTHLFDFLYSKGLDNLEAMRQRRPPAECRGGRERPVVVGSRPARKGIDHACGWKASGGGRPWGDGPIWSAVGGHRRLRRGCPVVLSSRLVGFVRPPSGGTLFVGPGGRSQRSINEEEDVFRDSAVRCFLNPFWKVLERLVFLRTLGRACRRGTCCR